MPLWGPMATATRTKTKKGQSELLKGGEFPYRTYPYREERERRGSLPSLPPQTPRPFKVKKGVQYREPPTPIGAEQKRYRDFTMAEPTPPLGTRSLTGSLSDLRAAGGGELPRRDSESQHPLRPRCRHRHNRYRNQEKQIPMREPASRQRQLDQGINPEKGDEPQRVSKRGKPKKNQRTEERTGAPPG
jgi:hypothetical protein